MRRSRLTIICLALLGACSAFGQTEAQKKELEEARKRLAEAQRVQNLFELENCQAAVKAAQAKVEGITKQRTAVTERMAANGDLIATKKRERTVLFDAIRAALLEQGLKPEEATERAEKSAPVVALAIVIADLEQTQAAAHSQMAELNKQLAAAQAALAESEARLRRHTATANNNELTAAKENLDKVEAAIEADERKFSFTTDLRAGMLYRFNHEQAVHVTQPDPSENRFTLVYGDRDGGRVLSSFTVSFNALLDTKSVRHIAKPLQVLSLGLWHPDRDRFGLTLLGNISDSGDLTVGFGPTWYYGRDGDVGFTTGVMAYSVQRIKTGFRPGKIDDTIPFDRVIRLGLFMGINYKLAKVGG